MSQQHEMSVRAKKRAMWRRISLWVLALAATAQLIRAFVGASQSGGESSGNAMVLGLVLAAGFIAVLLPLLFALHRRQLGAVRRLFPEKVVRQANMAPTTFDLLQDVAPSPKLKVNVATAAVLDVDELSLWRGTAEPKRVAHVRSEEPITYRTGALEHYGRQLPALLATVRVGGSSKTIPFIVLSDRTRLPKLAVGDELNEIVSDLEARRQTIGRLANEAE